MNKFRKMIVLMAIIYVAIIFLISYLLYYKKPNDDSKKQLSIQKEIEISKIQAYSAVDAISNTTNYQNPEWNLKINQYTDFAIYLNRLNDISDKNMISSIQISNIKIDNLKLGNAKLYYLNPQFFGDINKDSRIELESAEYNVINDNNFDNKSLNIPIFFEDLSNPITVRYVNEGIIDNYIVTGEEKISYDGSLLEKNQVNLDDIKGFISFDINISFINGQKNILKFNSSIPLENEEKTIFEENVFNQTDYIANTNYYKNDSILVNIHPVNIEKILSDNSSKIVSEEMTFEQIDLEYTTEYIENEELPSGTIWVNTIGQDGKQDVITIKRFENDELVSEKIVANNVNITPIDKIVEIGVGKRKNRFELKVGDIVYSTPDRLPIMSDKSKDSEKLITLEKGTPVEILEIFDSGWSYVFADSRYGFALSEGFSNINPLNLGDIENMGLEKSKDELLATLSKDMNMGEPSGFSLEQFKDVLSGNSQDVNKIFENNSDYFYYAEQEYGINGIFLAAIAIHESGWGTSRIALDKHNLFGYMAYDDSPYESSKYFTDYAEGIDLVARVLIKYYLNPAGKEIYGGNIAERKVLFWYYSKCCK